MEFPSSSFHYESPCSENKYMTLLHSIHSEPIREAVLSLCSELEASLQANVLLKMKVEDLAQYANTADTQIMTLTSELEKVQLTQEEKELKLRKNANSELSKLRDQVQLQESYINQILEEQEKNYNPKKSVAAFSASNEALMTSYIPCKKDSFTQTELEEQDETHFENEINMLRNSNSLLADKVHEITEERDQILLLLSSSREELEYTRSELQFSSVGNHSTFIGASSPNSFTEISPLCGPQNPLFFKNNSRFGYDTPESLTTPLSSPSSLSTEKEFSDFLESQILRDIGTADGESHLAREVSLLQEFIGSLQKKHSHLFEEWILSHKKCPLKKGKVTSSLASSSSISMTQNHPDSFEVKENSNFSFLQDLYLLYLHLESCSNLSQLNRPLQQPFDMEYLTQLSNDLIDELCYKSTQMYKKYVSELNFSVESLTQTNSHNSEITAPPFPAEYICTVQLAVLFFHRLAEEKKLSNEVSLAYFKSRQEHSHSVLNSSNSSTKSLSTFSTSMQKTLQSWKGSLTQPSHSAIKMVLSSQNSTFWNSFRKNISFSSKK